MPRINNAKNFAGVKYATQNFVNGLVNGANAEINVLKGLFDVNEQNYKLKASVLPELAITKTYTYAIGDEATLDAAIAAAIGSNAVQSGDVVILTSDDAAKADAYAGAYIFTADATSADVSGKYTKIYVQDGRVTSVGGAAPVAGAVALSVNGVNFADGAATIGLDNIAGTNLLVKSSTEGMTLNVSGNVITVGELTVDTAEITALRSEIGDKSGAIADKNIYSRLQTIEASLGLGGESGTEGIADLLAKEISDRKADDLVLVNGLNAEITARKADDAILEAAINAEIANRKADDEELERAINAEITERQANEETIISAVESAVKIASETKAVVTTETETVFTYEMQSAGIVFAVLDKNNNQVYPTIVYSEGKATLSADYEGAAEDNWTIYFASNPTLQLGAAVVESGIAKEGDNAALANKEVPAKVELTKQA